jgi:CitMHS family citrate-Mg2+:H+ or citrate-Ca2+:H+ symporter
MFFGLDKLAILGFLMVAAFMLLIMTRRLSVLVTLILLPAAFALMGGFAGSMGTMMLDGIRHIAPTGIMLMFAILYFGIMHDAGLFDPIIKVTLRLAQGDPLKILVGTAILSLLVSLDGDGSTTYIIVVTALLPLYQRLRINPLFLSGITMLAVGITNIVPWGGPTARAASALHLDAKEIFTPMIPALFGSALWVLFVAYWAGTQERKRLGIVSFSDLEEEAKTEKDPGCSKRFYINLLLTLCLLTALIFGICPLPVLFMLGFALALMINYPDIEAQKERIAAHAPSVLFVVALVFAAGIFTGILSGTKMVDAMTGTLLTVINREMGPHLAVITAIISLPLTFFISNDAFYFGVLPILSHAAIPYSISPAQMARASIIGQPIHLLSPLVPSTYLLVSLAKVEWGDHQRFTLGWAVVSCLIMLIIGITIGVIPL